MPAPRITVVTPSYNQASFLPHTIASVLSQNYPNLEYMVIDGGSRDESPAIIERHAEKLAYWVSERDSGHGDALNKGFARSTGEIMCWLNSDDLYMPWTLSTVAEIFEQCPDVDWVMGLNTWWDGRGRMMKAHAGHKNAYDFLLRSYGWIQQESVFWRRRLWDKAGGTINESYRLMVDGELWCRFFEHARLHSVECVLGGYREHGQNRASLHLQDVHREMQRAIRVLEDRCDPDIRAGARRLEHFCDLRRATRVAPAQRLAAKFAPDTLARAAYDHITFQDGRWASSRLPYYLPSEQARFPIVGPANRG